MALLFLDSFDHYATADILTKWSSTNPSPSINATGGRRGGGALSGGAVYRAGLVPGDNTVVFGVAIKFTTFLSAQSVIAVYNPSNLQISVVVTNTGAVELRRGGTSGALLGSYLGPLLFNQFYYFELKAVVHPTAGSAVVRLNEAPIIGPLTGINTAATGVAGWSTVGLQGPTTSNTFFDDLYVLDGTGPSPLNDLLGDCRVDVRVPTADGAHADWAPSTAGSRAAMVDDPAPDGDTTFNATATLNAIDTFVVQDVAVPGAAFYGVQLLHSQKKSDAGPCSIAAVARLGGVDYPSTPVNPSTTYAYVITPYSLNPATGLLWTEAEFNAAEFGYKRTA